MEISHCAADLYQMYELIIMDDDQTQIDFDTPVGDALSVFPEELR